MIRNKLACACVVGVTLAMSAPLVMAMKPADTATLPAPDAALQAAIDGTWRDRVYVQRDVYRHPGQTLAFFGIKPTQTVIEITPGGGWYSEILAPYLREKGKYVGAVVDPARCRKGAAATTRSVHATAWKRSSPLSRTSTASPPWWRTTRPRPASARTILQTWC